MNARQAFLSAVSVFLWSVSANVHSEGLSADPPPDPFGDQAQRILLDWAARLTGRTIASNQPVPQSHPQPASDLMAEVCPDRPARCQRLVAAYSIERREILYRETLDLARLFDQSFLVHEYVHYLQHLEHGDQVNASCQRILDNEREAYAAQAAYLRRHNIRLPVARALRGARCPGSDAVIASRS